MLTASAALARRSSAALSSVARANSAVIFIKVLSLSNLRNSKASRCFAMPGRSPTDANTASLNAVLPLAKLALMLLPSMSAPFIN